MPTQKLSFRNPRRGKQPRARIWHWLPRLTNHKRVAFATNAGAAKAIERAQAKLDRVYYLAKRKGVPLPDTGPMPPPPTMPGDDWIFLRRDIGTTRPVVKPAPAEPAPEAIQASA